MSFRRLLTGGTGAEAQGMSAVRPTNPPSPLRRPATVVGVCALLAIGACLNPMPEELPSDRDQAPVAVSGPAGPGSSGSAAGGGGGTGGLSLSASGGGGAASDANGASEQNSEAEPDAGTDSPDAGSEVGDAAP